MRGPLVLTLFGFGLGACFVDPGPAASGTGGTGTGADATTRASTGPGSGVTSEGSASVTSTTVAETTAAETTAAETTAAETRAGSSLGTTEEVASGTSGTGGTSGTSGTGGELPIPGCDPLYYADFGEEPLDLEMEGNWAWDAQAGELLVETMPGSISHAWIAGAGWTDVSIYARVLVASGTGWVSVRGRSSLPTLNHYFASVRVTGGGEVRFGEMVSGQSLFYETLGAPIQENEWVVIRLKLQGDLVEAEAAGLTMQKTDTTFKQGTAAIGGYDGVAARFDWLLVCAE